MELLEDNLLFNKIGLISKLHLQLNINSEEFRHLFMSNFGQGQVSTGLKRPNEFQGTLNQDSFKIHRSSTMFDSNTAGASGTYHETTGKLHLNIHIYTPIHTFLIFYSLLLIINILTIIQILDNPPGDVYIIILILIVFIIFTMIWPYFAFRNHVKKLKLDVERELHHWTRREANAPQQNV